MTTAETSDQRAAERDELQRLLAEKRAIKEKRIATRQLIPVARDGSLECTFQQEAMWFQHQLDPEFSEKLNRITFAVRLRGRLDEGALARALHVVAIRHEALRTRCVDEGGLPRQVIDPPADARPLDVVDLSEEALDDWISEQLQHPMDLATGPLWHTPLARLGHDDNVLMLIIHHIVADGWSVRILAEELSALYEAELDGQEEPELTPLPVQFADYAAWQRHRFSSDELDEQLTYWATKLADLPSVDFPTDRPLPARPTGAGTSRHRPLPEELALAARDYTRQHNVSLLAVAQAGLLTVLHRYTGKFDIPIGSIFSGRTRAETQPLVGFFCNGVLLRTRFEDRPSFGALVERCQETVYEASAHQDVPFNLVVNRLLKGRQPGDSSVDVMLALQPTSTSAGLELKGLSCEGLAAPNDQAGFKFALVITDEPDGGLNLEVEYSTEVLDHDRIDRFLDHFTAALAGGLAAPETTATDLDILSPAERHCVLDAWNPPPTPRPPGLLHQVTEGKEPDAIAVRYEGRSMTYAEVERRANQLAHMLRDRSVGPGQVVGLLINRGLHLLPAQLAVLKAGAAWLPLDPEYPMVRSRFMIEDAATPLVLTTSDLAEIAESLVLEAPETPLVYLDQLPDDGADEPPLVDIRPDDGAYVMYTSGSTGVPKGVLVSHRNAYAYCESSVDQFGMTSATRVSQLIDPIFDSNILESFPPLLGRGNTDQRTKGGLQRPGCLHRSRSLRGRHLRVHPARHDRASGPPAADDSEVRAISSGGEALSALQVNRWTRPSLDLHHTYGPTEVTVICTGYLCPTEPIDLQPPIGSSLPDNRAYVLDEWLRPTPIGIPGQLYSRASVLRSAT